MALYYMAGPTRPPSFPLSISYKTQFRARNKIGFDRIILTILSACSRSCTLGLTAMVARWNTVSLDGLIGFNELGSRLALRTREAFEGNVRPT